VDGQPRADARPEHALEWTDRDWKAYLFYTRCKAVGRFPEDEAVEIDAGIFRGVEDEFYNGGAKQLGQKLDSFFSVLVKLIAR